jgi:hypothetical protein
MLGQDHRVGQGVGHDRFVERQRRASRGLGQLEGQDEGGGQLTRVGVDQLLVEPEPRRGAVEDLAAHLERCAHQLLAVVANVDIASHHRLAFVGRDPEAGQQPLGPRPGVRAIEADVHVAEVVDLVRRDLGLVQQLHSRLSCRWLVPLASAANGIITRRHATDLSAACQVTRWS